VPELNDAQRAALAEQHRFLVWKALRLVWPRVQGHVDKQEIVSLGDLGLVEAASRWDPDGGASFATFAWYRVQGAIVDGLRKGSNLPKRVWAQLVALRAAGDYLEAQAAREAAARARGAAAPSDTQSRLAEVRDAMAAVEAVYVVSQRSFDEVEHTPESDDSLDDRIDRGSLRRRIDAALAALPERERALIEKHYFDGKNLLEAGAELGISKSWASRLHAQAVDRLRARLAGDTS
jgi:RNA polymerase sigma factor for flagellar operon FliA